MQREGINTTQLPYQNKQIYTKLNNNIDYTFFSMYWALVDIYELSNKAPRLNQEKIYIEHFCYCCIVTKSHLNLLQSHGLQPAGLLCPWDFPRKEYQSGLRFLLQGFFLNQGSNLHLLHWQADSLPLSHQGSHKENYINIFSPHNAIKLNVNDICKINESLGQNSDLLYSLGGRQGRIWIITPSLTAV